MLIQYLLIVGVVLTMVVFLRYHGTTSASASVKLGFVLFLVFGVLAVLYPEVVSVLARWMGVGRGTDLVLYGLVVAFAFAVLNTLLRFRDLEQRYVRLTRTIALRESERSNGARHRQPPADPAAQRRT